VRQRIISLTPATTEILFALGLDHEIVAVSSFCTWPPRAAEKEKAGSFSSPNIEKIISLKPDLVLVTGMEQARLALILHGLGIDYVSVDPKSIDELTDSIALIGSLTGRMPEAAAINAGIKKAIDQIRVSIGARSHDARPRIYMEIWYDPVMCPGLGSFVDDMIRHAGGINITSGLKRSYSRIDPEQIILKNPDKIVLAYMKPDSWIKNNVSNRLGWQDMRAVRYGRIYADIDPDIILRPGPRVTQGLKKLYEIFYEC
jgi:iron complex transport system substrate-binding protein